MYDLFLAATDVQAQHSILDVGVTSDQSYTSSNYLEKWYPYKSQITASGIDDARFLEELYPGMKFVMADAMNLPFEDQSYDVTHAAAVLEHVGSFERQVRFIRECARVTKHSIFLTTPNRWFPIEFHTILPIVHWLPKPVFRTIMQATGRGFFADEGNLNLMTSSELIRAARDALSEDAFDFRVETVNLWGWPSNLVLIADRRTPVTA